MEPGAERTAGEGETGAPSIGVLVSGRGSNLESIFAAILRGELRAHVAIVISSRPDAPALAIAATYQAPTRIIVPKDYQSRAAAGNAILAALRQAKVELVVLAGYKPILDSCVVDAYPLRIINIHPSLLPAFAGGMAPRPQADALAAGVKITGCTAHFVTAAVDEGPIIAQTPVPVYDGDTVEQLSARILEKEHEMLPRVIEDVLHGTVRVEGRRVLILPRSMDTMDTMDTMDAPDQQS